MPDPIDPRTIAILGATLDDARRWREEHPALQGARLYSPLSRSLDGAIVSDLYTTPAFDLLRSRDAEIALVMMRRNLAKMQGARRGG
ncbi:hypothetical protein [Microbacterium sp. VKM Ac-2923]|uniref:hypothetical protein n=1 Tax=Microbacterium sp. VKM Ac-2923 TaxID=2929476 RepID=UPI001FB333DC|nr:hypothetical protein [Microbacterium sp. VKM Ac-2923]MCJ1709240.1 hypothetical protein [Microbacterium sp. VKM Ac-2923]